MSRLGKAKKSQVFSLYTAPPFPSLVDVARSLNLRPDTVYSHGANDPEWYAEMKETREANEAAVIAERIRMAEAGLRDMVTSALRVREMHLEEGFAITDASVAHKAVTDTLDRVLGKPKQPHELGGKDGGPIRLTINVDRANAGRDV